MKPKGKLEIRRRSDTTTLEFVLPKTIGSLLRIDLPANPRTEYFLKFLRDSGVKFTTEYLKPLAINYPLRVSASSRLEL